MAQLDVFAFPFVRTAELHVRLQGFDNITSIVVNVSGETKTITKNLTNRVYVVTITDLEPSSDYSVSAIVSYGNGEEETASTSFTTSEEVEESLSNETSYEFKDFYIAIGQPGAYSKNMDYTTISDQGKREPNIIALYRDFGIRIKHAPYSPMAKIKNVVVQSWKDEDGDDVWLPMATGSQQGEYVPAVAHDAVDYNPTFVIFGDSEKMNSNAIIRELIKRIEGRWLKVWDEYTHMGFEGVYLLDVDDDPKFKRRNYDYVEFSLKFKVNGTNLDTPFEGIE